MPSMFYIRLPDGVESPSHLVFEDEPRTVCGRLRWGVAEEPGETFTGVFVGCQVCYRVARAARLATTTRGHVDPSRGHLPYC